MNITAAPSQGSCATVGNTVTCGLGTLPANSDATVQILGITPLVFGDITNRANVTQNEADPNLANNSASLITSVPDFPPTVRITSPTEGSNFQFPVDVPVLVEASDVDGVVTKVEFFNNGSKFGEKTSSPFNLTLTNAPPGLDVLTARATDSGGKQRDWFVCRLL